MTESSSLLVDAAGRHHRPAGNNPRIVSLVPSITELLFDLDLAGQMVGRTVFCVHPRDRIKSVASVGGTKQINAEKLERLNPTHVIVNVDETPRRLADELARSGYEVVVTHPIEVRDNLALYRHLGALFHRERQAEGLCARFETAFAAVTGASRSLPERRVLYLIWKNPWMTVSADTYIARMLASVNWRTVAHNPDNRYPTVDLNDDLLARTDLMLFASEPFPFKQTHIEAFRAEFPAHAAKATIIDAEMISWYGSRAIAGLTYLADFARARNSPPAATRWSGGFTRKRETEANASPLPREESIAPTASLPPPRRRR
jgi:ABC-type Fe3+-hydroxamate transport system substrate-binding protein